MAERDTFAGREPSSERARDSDEGASVQLIDGLSRIRGWSAEGLERARMLATARLTTQRRELERLGVKLGAGDPRVAALERKLDLDAEALEALAQHAERAATIVSSADRDRWIVHGHVRDAGGRGVAGVTVALYDKSGKWVDEFGYAETDAAGYYRLGGRGREHAALSLGVRKGRKLLLLDTAELSPTEGHSEYREIRLRARAPAPPRSRRPRRTVPKRPKRG